MFIYFTAGATHLADIPGLSLTATADRWDVAVQRLESVWIFGYQRLVDRLALVLHALATSPDRRWLSANNTRGYPPSDFQPGNRSYCMWTVITVDEDGSAGLDNYSVRQHNVFQITSCNPYYIEMLVFK